MNLSSLWLSLKNRVRRALDNLPTIDRVLKERHMYAAVLVELGDRASKFEPDEVEALAYVALAARMAQFASGGRLRGLEKLDLVLAFVRKNWKMLGKADDAFDRWWLELARPMLNSYAARAKQNKLWVAPV